MLSIDDVIERERQAAEEQRELFRLCPYHSQECNGSDICKCLKNKQDGCIKCEEEHEQIAKWLEELKDYQDKNKMVVRVDCDFENIDNIKNKIDELSKYAESQYNKAIDDVLKLPKYTFYDTSKEFMNIRIDAISIEDILKLKEKTNEQRKQSKPNRND